MTLFTYYEKCRITGFLFIMWLVSFMIGIFIALFFNNELGIAIVGTLPNKFLYGGIIGAVWVLHDLCTRIRELRHIKAILVT